MGPDTAYRLGMSITSVFLFLAILSLVWTPFEVTQISIAERFAAPSFSHPFGANHLGRDVFSMIMVGARTSILVAVLAVLLGAAIGTPLGLVASAYGGAIDEVISRMGDFAFAFPALIIAILLAAIYGPGILNAIIAIGIFNVPVFVRIARGASLEFLATGVCSKCQNLWQVAAPNSD